MKYVCHCALCDQFLSPFRGSCCVKNGPNLLKSNFYCMFWPNNAWKPFCIKLFYEMFLVYQIFNIFNCHCALFDQVMSPFRGSCCVKMAKSYSRSTFLACFDLIMSVFLLYYIVLWNMFSRAHFQHFIAIFPYFAPFFVWSCCVKMAQKY